MLLLIRHRFIHFTAFEQHEKGLAENSLKNMDASTVNPRVLPGFFRKEGLPWDNATPPTKTPFG